MYHGQPGFIRYVTWNLALKLGGFMVHTDLYNGYHGWHWLQLKGNLQIIINFCVVCVIDIKHMHINSITIL